jgi:hypothetical protein
VAEARRFFRARFRPGTLELQKVGELEVETEAGLIYGDGQDRSRLAIPDFALGLGVLEWLEVNLDSSLAVTKIGTADGRYVGEPLWLSGRFDLYNFEDERTGSSFGIGAQVGPRLPSLHNARGIGVGAIGLIGGGPKGLNFVLSVGSTVDAAQSLAIVYGLSVEYELERKHKWTLIGELAGARYFDDDPDQLLLNVGFGTDLTDALELELLLLTGPVYEGDRIGLMAGFTYDHSLW